MNPTTQTNKNRIQGDSSSRPRAARCGTVRFPGPGHEGSLFLVVMPRPPSLFGLALLPNVVNSSPALFALSTAPSEARTGPTLHHHRAENVAQSLCLGTPLLSIRVWGNTTTAVESIEIVENMSERSDWIFSNLDLQASLLSLCHIGCTRTPAQTPQPSFHIR